MRFLIDAQLPPALASALVGLGHGATHVSEVGLTDASEEALWTYAMNIAAVTLTKDEDFATMRRLAESGPAIGWIRFGNATNRALKERLLPKLPAVIAALESGELLVEVR